MKFLYYLLFSFSLPSISHAQTAIEFLKDEALKDLLRFEKFDDQHAREDDDGNIIKASHEVDPVLTDVFLENGNYEHYNHDGTVSDKANWRISNNALCLTFTWTDDEDAQGSLGYEGCWVIEKRGNCYMNYLKPYPWEKLTHEKDSEKYDHFFVKYGERANCQPLIS